MQIRTILRRFLRQSDGDDLIEYALLSTAVALAVYVGVTFLGNALSDMDTAVSSTSALAAPCSVADAVTNTGTAGDCPAPEPDEQGGGGGGTGGGGGGSTGRGGGGGGGAGS